MSDNNTNAPGHPVGALCMKCDSDEEEKSYRGEQLPITSGQKLLLFEALKKQLPKEWELNETTTLWLLALVDGLAEQLLVQYEKGGFDLRYSGYQSMIEMCNNVLTPREDQKKHWWHDRER